MCGVFVYVFDYELNQQTNRCYTQCSAHTIAVTFGHLQRNIWLNPEIWLSMVAVIFWLSIQMIFQWNATEAYMICLVNDVNNLLG